MGEQKNVTEKLMKLMNTELQKTERRQRIWTSEDGYKESFVLFLHPSSLVQITEKKIQKYCIRNTVEESRKLIINTT